MNQIELDVVYKSKKKGEIIVRRIFNKDKIRPFELMNPNESIARSKCVVYDVESYGTYTVKESYERLIDRINTERELKRIKIKGFGT